MRLLVLPQQYHNGDIHSIDLNRSNTRAATGGKDHIVNVWDLQQLTSSTTIDPEQLPNIKPINSIAVHEYPVTLVKWCPNSDNLFASADEQGQVSLTNTDTSSSEIVYPPQSLNDIKTTTVVDGDWSADGRLFAWSTDDGKVHLYDTVHQTHQYLIDSVADSDGERKVTIQRSVAFDPLNRFFVSMGDDTFVTVFQHQYNAKNQYEVKIVGKISKLMGTTASISAGIKYRRVSWSCDGEYFAVPNATKSQTSLISILSASNDWENTISLVGHDMNCDLVKFGPRLLTSEEEQSPGVPQVFHIIATAGHDNTLVLWNSTRESPVLVVRDVTQKPIADLVWTKDGENVLMTTLDGRIIIVNFEGNELGAPASSALVEHLKVLQQEKVKTVSGKSETDAAASKKKSATDVIKQSDATNLHELAKAKAEAENSEKNKSEVTNDDGNTLAVHSGHSDEVTPIVSEPGPKENSHSAQSLSSVMDRRSSTADGTKTATSKPAKAKTAKEAPAVSKVTTKNGKKRIQPTLISNGNDNRIAAISSETTEPISVGSNSKTPMEFERPTYTVSEEVFKESKRTKQSDDGGPAKKAKRELEPVRFLGSVVPNPNTTFSKIRLSVPKARAAFRISMDTESLDIKNGQGNENAPARVTNFKGDTQVWSDFIPRLIQLGTKGEGFWAISTSDGQIITYSLLSGKRLLPPIVLGSPLSFLESKGKYLMAVTCVAELYVWDMDLKKIHLHSPSTLSSLFDLNNKFQEETLSKSDNVTMCAITSHGIPLVTLSNGSGYMFNIDMGVWQTISETWWAFGSHYWDSIADDKISEVNKSGSDRASSLIGLLEHKTNEELLRKSRTGRGKFFNKISKNMIMKEGFENLENTISLSHLENRILCCELLGEQKDFKNFLITYANRLCELGLKAKLFEICDKIGALGEDSQEPKTICGLDRRELLKEIILSCAEHRGSQRILTHFGAQLGILQEEY